MSTTEDQITTADDQYDAAIEEDDERSYLRMCAAQGREPIATMTVGQPAPEPAARLGFKDATRTVAAQYAAGVDLDAIAAHHDDVTASLQSDAQTAPGRAFAREYGDTARTLIADLREDAAVARRQSEAACTKPDGTPHPDPRLAAHGWQVEGGVYVNRRRAAELDADREAG